MRVGVEDDDEEDDDEFLSVLCDWGVESFESGEDLPKVLDAVLFRFKDGLAIVEGSEDRANSDEVRLEEIVCARGRGTGD